MRPPATPDNLVDSKNPRHTDNCWKYFAHPLEDGQVNLNRVVCKLCKCTLKFQGNTTSSMNTHLKMKHLITPALSAMTTDSDLKRKNPNTRSIQSMVNTPEMLLYPRKEGDNIQEMMLYPRVEGDNTPEIDAMP